MRAAKLPCFPYPSTNSLAEAFKRGEGRLTILSEGGKPLAVTCHKLSLASYASLFGSEVTCRYGIQYNNGDARDEIKKQKS